MKSFKPLLLVLSLVICLISCEKITENTMTVSGTVDGLKKGTLYFQKAQDSILVTIDSIKVKGDGAFTFSYELESPELFYLYLDKADNNDINDRITFFGEPGEIQINTAWNTFDSNSKITGSKSHEKFTEFQEVLSRFNTREFELSRALLLSENEMTKEELDSLINLRDKNVIRRYQYVLNFGLNNPNSYVTPYVTLVEAPDANPKYLDSIYNSLNREVTNSIYGKKLKSYLGNLN
jgi:hypothetical protein